MDCMVASDQLTQLIRYLQAETSLLRSRHMLLYYLYTQSGAQQVLLLCQHTLSLPLVCIDQCGEPVEQMTLSAGVCSIPTDGFLGRVLTVPTGRISYSARYGYERAQEQQMLPEERLLLQAYSAVQLCAIGTSAQEPRGVLVFCFAETKPPADESQEETSFLASAELRICLTLLSSYLNDEDDLATPPLLVKRERERIARDLHDGTLQYLVHALHRLEYIERQLETVSYQTHELVVVQGELHQTAVLLTRTLDELRRSVTSLMPPQLEQHDLLSALHMLLAEIRETMPTLEMHTDLRAVHRVPLALEGTIFRLVQEALHNVSQHAHASSVSLRVRATTGMLFVEVSDNGIGLFATEQLGTPNMVPHVGLGLRSMRERVEAVGGRCEIEGLPGRGTSVRARFTLPRSSRVLTEREREILSLVSEGMSNEAIAQHLSISRETVKSHVHHIMQKLRVKDRTQAAVLAMQQRWL